ncbi:MAG: porin family protein [Ekhidna sp.]|nr:porin family protein [Ekhidna sp.]
MSNITLTLSIILISLTSTLTFSQVRIGFQGGLNLNDVAGDKIEDDSYVGNTKFKAGVNFGVVADIALQEQFSFQPGLLYTSKGTSEKGLEDDDYNMVRLDYLEVPLLFNYSFTDQFSGFIGPYFAFGLGGVDKYKFINGQKGEVDYKATGGEVKLSELRFAEEAYLISELIPEDEEICFNNVDYGLNFGVGFNLSNEATIRLGYSLGLNNLSVDIIDDIDDIDIIFDADDRKVFNRVLSLSFVYYLKLNTKNYNYDYLDDYLEP